MKILHLFNLSKSKLFLTIFIVTIFTFSLNSEIAFAQVPRFEQNIKNQELGFGTRFYQSLSCADLSGQIEEITLSMTPISSSNAQYRIQIARPGEDFDTSSLVAGRTATAYTGPVSQQNDVVFHFQNLIDVTNEMCAGINSVTMRITSVSGSQYVYINGSLSNPYAGGGLIEGGFTGNKDAYFIVNGEANINHAPILNTIGNKIAIEGSYMTFTLHAEDQDQVKEVLYQADNLPQGAVFNGKTFYWVPAFNQAGAYPNINFTAIDAGNNGLSSQTDSESISISVNESLPNLNRLEQNIKTQQLAFGNRFYQSLSCADLDGQIEQIALSMTPISSSNTQYKIQIARPGEDFDTAPLVAIRTATAYTGPISQQNDVIFSFQNPIDIDNELCAGVSSVTMRIRAVNESQYVYINGSLANTYAGGGLVENGFTTSKDAYFIVNGHVQINSVPDLSLISNKSVSETQILNFTVSATDPDNDTVTLSASGLPSGATFNATTGVFDWTPGYTAAGTYQVTFTATENTPEALSDSETVTITVSNTNRAPELNPIGNKVVSEGQTLQFTVSASDPDNDTITLSAAHLPVGSSFNASTGVFTWNTSYSDDGNYPDIEFAATDNGSPIELDVELITITVGNVNRMPEITIPGPQEVLEGHLLSFSVSATDPDNDSVTLSATNLPSGSSFNPTSGTFTWTPTLAQSGAYTITLVATDNGSPVESASTDVVVTVGDDPTPVEQTQNLVNQVVTIVIPQNVENSYLANLQKVEPFILDGKITAALNQLNAFKNKIQNDYQRGILTQAQYNSLLQAVNSLIADLSS